MTNSDQHWMARARTRIVNCTPRKLRPMLVVAVLIFAMFAAQVAGVAINYLYGTHRAIDFRLIGYLGLCMSAAAITYGQFSALLAELPRAGCWLQGIAMSVAFWLTATLLASRTSVQSAGDLVALGILILASGIFAGCLIWLNRGHQETP